MWATYTAQFQFMLLVNWSGFEKNYHIPDVDFSGTVYNRERPIFLKTKSKHKPQTENVTLKIN